MPGLVMSSTTFIESLGPRSFKNLFASCLGALGEARPSWYWLVQIREMKANNQECLFYLY